jgi:hypothetical protein
MASDKTIANGIIQSYAGADRKDVLKMLQSSAKAARADEQASIQSTIAEHRRMLKASLEGRTNKVERLKIVQSIRTLDALVQVVVGSDPKA